MHRRSADEFIVMGICLICLVGLVPFTFIRLMLGDWLVAGIDALGACCSGYCFYFVYRNHRVGWIGSFLGVLALSGMTVNVTVLGSEDVFFLYPVIISVFFLMAPLPALVLSSMSVLWVTFTWVLSEPSLHAAKIALSLSGTMLFAFTFAWQRNRQHDELLQASRTDPLTGAGNRRALHEQLHDWIAAVKRDHHEMSLLILDLDDFKHVNDAQGHQVGDQVLVRLADLIRSRIRDSDYLYRYGGDEFLILVNHADATQTVALAEDIRSLIEADRDTSASGVTVSIGISEYHTGESAEEWLNRADSAMYDSKRAGKNAVSGVGAFAAP